MKKPATRKILSTKEEVKTRLPEKNLPTVYKWKVYQQSKNESLPAKVYQKYTRSLPAVYQQEEEVGKGEEEDEKRGEENEVHTQPSTTDGQPHPSTWQNNHNLANACVDIGDGAV